MTISNTQKWLGLYSTNFNVETLLKMHLDSLLTYTFGTHKSISTLHVEFSNQAGRKQCVCGGVQGRDLQVPGLTRNATGNPSYQILLFGGRSSKEKNYGLQPIGTHYVMDCNKLKQLQVQPSLHANHVKLSTREPSGVVVILQCCC